MGDPEHDFRLEKRLRQLDPKLHRRFTDAVFALQYNLSNYKLIFPEYTDHTMLHSLTVIDFCNRLMGEQVEKLNADEIYTLLMGCYFHDTGMGISKKDYELFCSQIDFGNYFDTNDRNNIPKTIRTFHHEFSGRFIRKYSELFEIPSEEHIRAITQIARGHRKTDLFDESEYPVAFEVPGGNTVCLPYLASLIRLADEIDVTASRNPKLLYDLESLTDEKEIFYNKMNKAVRTMDITPDSFILRLDDSEITDTGSYSASDLRESLIRMAEKMQYTLDYCRHVVGERTPFRISQEKVLIEDEN